jgi:hypothetical protein
VLAAAVAVAGLVLGVPAAVSAPGGTMQWKASFVARDHDVSGNATVVSPDGRTVFVTGDAFEGGTSDTGFCQRNSNRPRPLVQVIEVEARSAAWARSRWRSRGQSTVLAMVAGAVPHLRRLNTNAPTPPASRAASGAKGPGEQPSSASRSR